MASINSLLLYKQRPARLVEAGDRYIIEMDGGETLRVRPKDVVVLHPGPLKSLVELKHAGPPVSALFEAAWEMLEGETISLPDLADLVYGAFTPVTAWATWQFVNTGLLFEGGPEAVRARTQAEVARRQQEREQAEAGQLAWRAFMDRVRGGHVAAEDRDFLRDVEQLALGRAARSQVLRELKRAETPENAHALLLELGVWDATTNPYPARLGMALDQPDLPVPALPPEPRRDLTYLAAFAIDDAGTDTPDDAISLEETERGLRLWVHVADAAALVQPDSPLDLEARARVGSLHLPEGTIHLLPRAVVLQLGLGLSEESPALSFGIDLTETGEVQGMEIAPSRVRVTRLSYDEAETRMDQPPFDHLERVVAAVRSRRKVRGAVMIDFPEVNIDVEGGRVILRRLPPLRSRAAVEEAMILTGMETARFAAARNLLLPFSQQEPVETDERPQSLSGMFALRKMMKRSRVSLAPGPHSGLGVPAYVQVTSPLRRYLDLVVHQQMRAYLQGQPLFNETDLLERLAAVELASGALRQAETLSERHWTAVYLLQHPGWRGEGILVEKRGSSGIVIIPELAVETRVHLPRDIPLDQALPVALSGVNLPQRDAAFRVEIRRG